MIVLSFTARFTPRSQCNKRQHGKQQFSILCGLPAGALQAAMHRAILARLVVEFYATVGPVGPLHHHHLMVAPPAPPAPRRRPVEIRDRHLRPAQKRPENINTIRFITNYLQATPFRAICLDQEHACFAVLFPAAIYDCSFLVTCINKSPTLACALTLFARIHRRRACIHLRW